MKKLLIVQLLTVFLFAGLKAQDSEQIVMHIDDKAITKGEFEYIFNKNNTDTESEESVKDYVDLFVKFKLKVIEAEARGLDTVPSFITELAGYRDQLAKPYLIDQELNDKLMNDAYFRLSHEVKASHILIKTDFEKGDTLAAFNKISDIKKRIEAGEDFAKLAVENSEDPSAATNKGDLGYFSGFQMVLPFEEAAFNTEIGEVSDIIRTRFGYHVLKVFDLKESPGEVKVAHILFLNQQDATPPQRQATHARAEKAYAHIMKTGMDFGLAAKEYSDDTQSAAEGGELPWFGNGMMVPEFTKEAFSLTEKGEMTKLFESRFGYHIIKLIDKRPFPSFAEKKDDIKQRLERTERGKMPDEMFISKLKKAYNYTKHDDALAEMVEISKKYTYRDSMFKVVTRDLVKPVMTLDGIDYSLAHFADYLIENPRGETPDEEKRVAMKYDRYHIQVLRDYEKSILEKKYPDFRYLMQEYHDGILLFEISSEEVWDKASKDVVGMEKFQKKNNKKYKWDEEVFRGKVYFCQNDSVKSLVSNLLEENTADSTILKQINETGPFVSIEEGSYTKGKLNAVDADVFKSKDYEPFKHFTSVITKGKLYKVGTKRTFEETQRGKLISDYQTYLEDQWIKGLKKKYKIKLNKKVLKTVSIK